MSTSPAQRRYNRSVLVLSALYAALLFASTLIFRHAHPTGLLAVAVAILPALPIVGMFAAVGRCLVRERDEYQRLILVRQILIASGIALSLATVWGFLESFHVAPHIDAYYLAVVWFGGLGIGACVNRVVERRA